MVIDFEHHYIPIELARRGINMLGGSIIEGRDMSLTNRGIYNA